MQSYGVDEVFVKEDVGRLFSFRGSRKRKRSEKLSDSEPVGFQRQASGFQRQASFRRQGSSTTEGKEGTKRQLSTKEDEKADEDIPDVSFFRIIRYNAKEWWLIILGVIGAAINGSIFPLFAVFFGEILGVFGDPMNALNRIHMWAALFIVLGIVSGIAIFLKVNGIN